MRVIPVIAAFLAAGGAVGAEYRPPALLEDPAPTTIEAAAPPSLKQADGYGGVTFECQIQLDGTLKDCAAVQELPAGAGVADAARKLLPLYRYQPALIDGTPVVTPMALQILFRPRNYTPPRATRSPTDEEKRAVAPAEVFGRSEPAVTIVLCIAEITGKLGDCRVAPSLRNEPALDAAALKLAPMYDGEPGKVAGHPVATLVFNRVRWTLSGGRPDGQPRVLDTPIWRAAPTYADLTAAYPEQARKLAVSGQVRLNCDVTADGTLQPCRVASETPGGFGFAAAAQSLVAHFRAPLKAPSGMSTQGMTINLPVTFPKELLGGRLPAYEHVAFTAVPGQSDLPKVAYKDPVDVVLGCRVGAEGWLQDCKVRSEAPRGGNLASAALAMAPKFAMSLWTPEGLPTQGADVNVPIRFDVKP